MVGFSHQAMKTMMCLSLMNNPFYFQYHAYNCPWVKWLYDCVDDAVIVGRMQDIYAIHGNTNRPMRVQPFTCAVSIHTLVLPALHRQTWHTTTLFW